MRRNSFFAAAAAILILFCAALAFAQNGEDITFTVSMPKPYTHLFEVEIRVSNSMARLHGGQETLVMPVWTPGSYLIREFERHVQDFSATGMNGHPLAWEKLNKDSWRVTVPEGEHEWRATYRVYANELSVRTSELNSDHAFWNNATLLMYLDGKIQHTARLKINPPKGWKIATGLLAVADQPNTFWAENFDILYDSPVEVSNFKVIPFSVKGVPHRIVIDGEGNYEPDRMRQDVQKIVAAEVELMGGEIPYHDYTFILHLRSNAGGGLEHLNSTALGYPSFGFKIATGERSSSAAPFGVQPERDYRGFLSLVAHEFFHLWNVKRIRPDALGPFDYTKENYTKLLWVAEGITDYYADVALRRAGLISDKEFLDGQARAFQSLQETPGRLVQSAEESSFDTWIKYYRQDENSINSQVSYYEKGAILGLLLDLEIRKRSGGAKSLDDVMHYLYNEFYKKGRNYTPPDFQKACELMAGVSLEQFFSRYVRARDELDYDAGLNAAGLRLDTNVVPESVSKSARLRSFGVDLAPEGERLMVRRVYAGSAAYEQGLNAGDQIVAFDGSRASGDFVVARLSEKRPGDVVHLMIFRFDELRSLDIKLGTPRIAIYRIVPLPQPNEQQKRIYQSWLGSPLK